MRTHGTGRRFKKDNAARSTWPLSTERVWDPLRHILTSAAALAWPPKLRRSAARKLRGLTLRLPLLAIARERVRTAEFLVGELENLPFPDNTFDFVTGFNSLQYAGNPTIALKETKRVAKPGALVLIMTWGEPAGMQAAALVAALRPLMPAPPAGAPGPFALSDESALRAFAAAAGLEPIEIFDVASPWKYESLEVALRGLRSSGVAARAAANSSEESVNAAHEAALQPFRNADQGFVIQASFRCLLARA